MIDKGNDHYIHITPPYKKAVPDRTNYSPILQALSLLDGEPPELPQPKPRGRDRANAGYNSNNLELPAISNLPNNNYGKVLVKKSLRPSLMGAFNRLKEPTQGGYKKTRRWRVSPKRNTKKRN
jgi:hypothetical protein